MKQHDLSQNRIEGGFFVHRRIDAGQYPFAWSRDAGEKQWFVGAYRDSGAPIRDALIRMIAEAKQRVFVASFMLGDEELIQELIQTAKRLRGGVYVITALDERSLGRGLREFEEEDGPPESPEERQKNFSRLTSEGVYVRGHESCHAKFAVIDNSIALVGSANFVKNGFEYTGEANLVLRDREQVRQMARLFTELWYGGCVWEIPPGSDTYMVADRAPKEPPCRPKTPLRTGSEVVWTNESDQMSLLEAIHDTIDAAQVNLILSSYSIVGMRENRSLLFDSLQRAMDRGVHARLFVRQRNAWPGQMADLLTAHDMGVEIHADLRNHAKTVIADNNIAVVFSANFDSNHGLDSGVEAGVRLINPEVVREVIRYMNHIISNADTLFLRDPTMAEVDGKLAARWCKAWPYGQGELLTIQGDASASEAFAREAADGPCLFENDGAENISLHAGNMTLKGTVEDHQFTLQSTDMRDTATTELLSTWLQSVRRGGIGTSEKQGFCTAMLAWD